jgi:hypothetical protein
MNIKMQHLISDIEGVSGMKLLRELQMVWMILKHYYPLLM